MTDPLAGGRTTTDVLLEIVASNRAGARAGLYSICSAERFVLEAAMAQATADHTLLCIESTCNQVNQFGGYTGMTPAAFRDFRRAGGRRDRLRPRPRDLRRRPPGAARVARRAGGPGDGQGPRPGARLRRRRLHQDPPRREHAAGRRPGRARVAARRHAGGAAHGRARRGGRDRLGRAACRQPAPAVCGGHRGAGPRRRDRGRRRSGGHHATARRPHARAHRRGVLRARPRGRLGAGDRPRRAAGRGVRQRVRLRLRPPTARARWWPGSSGNARCSSRRTRPTTSRPPRWPASSPTTSRCSRSDRRSPTPSARPCSSSSARSASCSAAQARASRASARPSSAP